MPASNVDLDIHEEIQDHESNWKPKCEVALEGRSASQWSVPRCDQNPHKNSPKFRRSTLVLDPAGMPFSETLS